VPAITDVAIRAAKPGTTLWDSSLKGFGVRCLESGTKTFIVLIASGRRQSIGRYPIISLADARTEAKRILAEKALGKVRPTHTAFEDARDAFLKECESRLRPITVKLYRRHLATHYAFGRKGVGDITPREIVRNLNALNDRPSEKEHAARIGRTFFTWCVGQHIIDRSPMETIAKPPVGPSRERVLSEEELKAVYKAARTAKTGFHRLICLLIHTGCRRGEMTALKWAYIGSDTISLPAEITKNRRSHAFPIGPATQALLASFPRVEGNPYVFPSSREHVRGKPSAVMTGYSAAKHAFDEACGVTGWTLHDLRRTFSTGLADLDVPPHIIERLLNHASGEISGVAATYNRSRYARPMREAVEKWEAHLAALL
jgi:integrase